MKNTPKPGKVATTSLNVENENLEKMRIAFPQFVKDGEIDFDTFKAFFDKEGFIAGEEKYSLSWAGKSDAFRAIRTPATGTLIPQPELSKNWDSTQNLFIEGDNLEVLKLLQKHYRGQVKMIYIDPPYNTGKDFIYKDNFHEGVSDYYERTGQSENGIKLTSNPESNGRYHSDWLTMMYPRLYLGKQLLKDDGVIFVSIDDKEVANLRLVLDEIFGEENFLGQMVWHSRGRSKTVISIDHEYVLVFAKNKKVIIPLYDKNPNQIANWYGQQIERSYSNPDKDSRGLWRDAQHTVTENKAHYTYSINSKTGEILENEVVNNEVWYGHETWMYPIDTIKKLFNDNRLFFKKSSGHLALKVKKFASEEEPITSLEGLIQRDDISSRHGTEELEPIFDNNNFFEYPKPSELIRRFIKASTKGDDAVLDFFAGSGTTAHAVMAQNAEDEGNRKYICVQLPEETDPESEAFKAGYQTIADIARERIRRVGKKMVKGDIGFKSLKLKKSNYRRWEVITSEDDEKTFLNRSGVFAEMPLINGYDEKSVVYEALLKEGLDMNAKVEKKKISKLEVWDVSDGDRHMVICFSKKLTLEQIEGLSLKTSDTFICFDSALDDSTKINLVRVATVKTV